MSSGLFLSFSFLIKNLRKKEEDNFLYGKYIFFLNKKKRIKRCKKGDLDLKNVVCVCMKRCCLF